MPFGLGTNFDPNGEPRELLIPGIKPEFTTTTPLADAATFNSGIIHIGQFQHLSVQVDSDRSCSLTWYWYSDSAGATLVRTFTIPFTTGNGISFFGEAVFAPYLRIIVTNNSGAVMTRLLHQVRLTDQPYVSTVLRANDSVPSNVLTAVGKSIMAGFNVATGVIYNVDVDTTGAGKVYLSGALATAIDTELDNIEASLTAMEANDDANTTDIRNTIESVGEELEVVINAEHTSTRTQVDLVRTTLDAKITSDGALTRTQINLATTQLVAVNSELDTQTVLLQGISASAATATTTAPALNATTSTTIKTASTNFIGVSISNGSTESVWIKFQAASVDNLKRGIYLKPNAFYEMPLGQKYTGEISAIANAGTPTINVVVY